MKIYLIRKRTFVILFLLIISFILFSVLYTRGYMRTFSTTGEEISEPIRNGDLQSNKMAFTCNVDWGNEVIPKLLGILEKKNIKVTFFISGRWASNNPELLKLIYQKGHEIGNHGYSHKMHSKITEHENYAEIKKTEDAIQEILGIKPKFFAPPAGDCNNITINVARKLGYKTILWNIDTIDWKEGSTAQIIINRVMKKPHGGAILLMHPKEATVEALPDLIDKIEKEGIKIGTVSDLLQ